jgi:hypothetical protein
LVHECHHAFYRQQRLGLGILGDETTTAWWLMMLMFERKNPIFNGGRILLLMVTNANFWWSNPILEIRFYWCLWWLSVFP